MKIRTLAMLVAAAVTFARALAGPIAHYTFDSVDNGTTPDAVGPAFATLGGGVSINTSVEGRIGSGVLEMTHANGSGLVAVDGAVTSNSFDWSANGARTITFWWRAKTPNVNTQAGAYVSFGDTSANGTRFDIREQLASPLRVEVQGTGQNTSPANFDNGQWHFVAVTVPPAAEFKDIAWFAGARGGALSGNLNTSNSRLMALPVGASIRIAWVLNGTGGATQDFMGWYIDDVVVDQTST
jgi:hypothetical protein